MLKKSTVAVLFLFVLGVIYSCDTSKKVIKNVDSSKLEETFEVNMGDSLKIKISANPSTGYKWEMRSKIKPKVIKFESKKYTPNNPDKNFIGGGGKDTWTFSTLKKGEVFLYFVSVRSEKEKIDKEKYYKVIVK